METIINSRHMVSYSYFFQKVVILCKTKRSIRSGGKTQGKICNFLKSENFSKSFLRIDLPEAHQDFLVVPNTHGLRTPNEGINQRNLKNLADVADKICFGRTKEFGIGIEFSAVQ